jgi:hypothetical protein
MAAWEREREQKAAAEEHPAADLLFLGACPTLQVSVVDAAVWRAAG